MAPDPGEKVRKTWVQKTQVQRTQVQRTQVQRTQVQRTQVERTQVENTGRSSDVTRFLARLPAGLAARFDAEQLAAVELHFGMRHRTHHTIDIRRRLRLPFLRCYVVLLAGRERAAE